MSDIRSREHRGPSGRGERGTALPHLEWTIGMPDFIEVCPKITGDRWRLANTELSEGSIRLHSEAQYSSSAKVARLLRERIKASIEADALEKALTRTFLATIDLKAQATNSRTLRPPAVAETF